MFKVHALGCALSYLIGNPFFKFTPAKIRKSFGYSLLSVIISCKIFSTRGKGPSFCLSFRLLFFVSLQAVAVEVAALAEGAAAGGGRLAAVVVDEDVQRHGALEAEAAGEVGEADVGVAQQLVGLAGAPGHVELAGVHAGEQAQQVAQIGGADAPAAAEARGVAVLAELVADGVEDVDARWSRVDIEGEPDDLHLLLVEAAAAGEGGDVEAVEVELRFQSHDCSVFWGQR